MPSFADSIVLFVLALLLFGPKKLPVLARELGKWIGEFRRASNEFKMQMEEELRLSEQEERQKRIAAMEAAAPIAPPLPEPEHPHLPRTAPENTIAPPNTSSTGIPTPDTSSAVILTLSEAKGKDLSISADAPHTVFEAPTEPLATTAIIPETLDGVRPIPIASSGDLHMMPPATGLPQSRPRNVTAESNPLNGLLDSIPETRTPAPTAEAETEPETAAHGD